MSSKNAPWRAGLTGRITSAEIDVATEELAARPDTKRPGNVGVTLADRCRKAREREIIVLAYLSVGCGRRRIAAKEGWTLAAVARTYVRLKKQRLICQKKKRYVLTEKGWRKLSESATSADGLTVPAS